MFNFKSLFLCLSISTVITGFVVAQPPPPSASSKNANTSNDNQNKQSFVSLDGGFSIALPQWISAFEGVKPIAGVSKGGSQFTWQIPQGFYMVAYADRIFSPDGSKQILQDAADGLINQITANGGKLINKKDFTFNGHSGIEVKMSPQAGVVGISRYILVKERMYILTTGWRDGEDGKQQLKALDSFKLIDTKAVIAQKIEEATPAPLPQSPVTKKLKSDAEDEGLKGRVKSVTETKEDLTGTWVVSGVRTSSEDFYDESGNQTKHIYYDYRGNPSNVTVYGFIDGMRVSKYGNSVRYEYNPPPPAPPPPGVKPPSVEKSKPVDSRYSTKYEYKYDDKGRLQETIRYRNNGEMTGKTVYLYEGNKLDETSYDKDGKITFKTIEVFDEKGNTVEKTFVRQDSKYADSNYNYTYQSFDEKGNWTKRTVTGKEGQYGGGLKNQNYVEYRTITYYP